MNDEGIPLSNGWPRHIDAMAEHLSPIRPAEVDRGWWEGLFNIERVLYSIIGGAEF